MIVRNAVWRQETETAVVTVTVIVTALLKAVTAVAAYPSDSYSSLVGMSSIDCSTLFIEDVIHMAVQMYNHMELTMEDNTFQRGETNLD